MSDVCPTCGEEFADCKCFKNKRTVVKKKEDKVCKHCGGLL